ncbi:BTAD domain-containing putative transcriptional regulator [Streptomyces sp. CAU 1734]|uniref:BTAD domain-containing putative transcriptional regulator n=1 Tax=Streptomyces sp. CAU 1734 TaxID=3140360 RepID=UPI0032618852
MEVRSAGRSFEVGTPRQQTVLAALVVDARRPVAIETLINRVWDRTPPADPRAVLYSHLSRIRRMLAQAGPLADGTTVRIERRHAGYLLDADPNLVDLHRFRRLSDEGCDRRRADEARAAALAEALRLWRGSPLAGLPGEWAAQVRESWHQRRLDAVVQWARIELRLGRPASVIAVLPDLTTEYPLVEPFEALLMRALHETGRGAEALDRYTAVRQRLADRLGTDPGPELRALHRSVLQGELPPRPPAPAAPPAPVTPPIPAIAPAPVTPPAPEPTATGRPASAASSAEEPRWPRLPFAPGPYTRRTLLGALVAAVVLPAAIGAAYLFQGGEENGSPSNPAARSAARPAAKPVSVERVQELFATAHELDRAGRRHDAKAAIGSALRHYGEAIRSNPDRNAAPLAPAIIQALGRAGVDFSVPTGALRSWLANPVHTPYPAISQTFLLRGWRLRAPVHLDVIVANYESAPGVTSPREIAEVRLDVLKAAVVEGSNSRHGTETRDFGQLLAPR